MLHAFLVYQLLAFPPTEGFGSQNGNKTQTGAFDYWSESIWASFHKLVGLLLCPGYLWYSSCYSLGYYRLTYGIHSSVKSLVFVEWHFSLQFLLLSSAMLKTWKTGSPSRRGWPSGGSCLNSSFSLWELSSNNRLVLRVPYTWDTYLYVDSIDYYTRSDNITQRTQCLV